MRSSRVGILLFVVACLPLYADYEALKAYKMKVQNEPKIEKMSQFRQKVRYYRVDFKDINQMDTYRLEQDFSLQLYQCIADGICIFQFQNYMRDDLNINSVMNKEPNIENIRAYKPYGFKAF